MALFRDLYETGLLTEELVAKLVAKGNKQLIDDAILLDYLEVVKLIIKNGFDDTKNNNFGLKTALRTRKLEILKYFKEIGMFDVKIANGYLGNVVSAGCLDLVQFMIESGCDVQYDNNAAIKNSSFNGHLEMVKFLIEHGANVKASNNWSIRFATENGHLEVVKLLIEHGADIEIASRYASCTKVKEYLLSLSNVSYYGIMVDKKLDIKLPELQEIVRDNKYYYVYKCELVNTGYVVTDQINRYNILSQFGQVMYFNKI